MREGDSIGVQAEQGKPRLVRRRDGRSAQRLDLMITDVGLPGLNGRQLADIARTHVPLLPDPLDHVATRLIIVCVHLPGVLTDPHGRL
jgi:CheY-like chemotaxis protein